MYLLGSTSINFSHINKTLTTGYEIKICELVFTCPKWRIRLQISGILWNKQDRESNQWRWGELTKNNANSQKLDSTTSSKSGQGPASISLFLWIWIWIRRNPGYREYSHTVTLILGGLGGSISPKRFIKT